MQTPSAQSLKLQYTARWWSFTSSVRQFIEAFCRHLTPDPDFSAKVGMAAHELLENAVKYVDHPDASIRIELERDAREVRVRVVNPSLPRHIDVLRDEYAAVSAADPLEIYILKLQSDTEQDTSRLGLARIRHEAEARMALAIDRNMVTMEATFDIPAAVHFEGTTR